jgi:hypothetical protein
MCEQTKNEALITWAASDLATGIIYFDTVSPVTISSSTPRVTASLYGNYAQSKANIRNLTASTTYYYLVVLRLDSDEEVISQEMSFTTEK